MNAAKADDAGEATTSGSASGGTGGTNETCTIVMGEPVLLFSWSVADSCRGVGSSSR